ncbi:histidine kinase, partial [Crossiella equi]
MREQLLAVWGLLVRDRDADWGPPVPLLPGPRAVRLAVALVSTVPLTWMLALTWGEAVNPMAGGLLVLAHLLPWVLSHRRPLTAWRLVLAVLVLLAVLPLVVDLPRVLPGAPPVERPWSVGALALVPPLFAAAARAPRDRRVPLTACTVAAVALASALPAAGLPDSPIPVFLAAAVLVLAFSRARERSTASELAWVSTAMAAEQAKTAVLAERSRIARELHDVIAHHLSM